MLTTKVDIGKSRRSLQELLSLVASGTEVVLMEDNVPIARLIPIEKRIPGLHADTPYSMSDDFDAPLPDEFWMGSK